MATAISSSVNICVFLIIGTGIFLVLICVAFDSHRDEINSIQRNTDRVKRSASASIPNSHPEALLSILDFTTANIRRITHEKKVNELKDKEKITNQFVEGLDDDIQFIQDNVKEALNITINVFELKKKVNMSLDLYRQHLDNPKEQKSIDDFKKEAETLPETLQALLDGRLFGRNSATVDVVASLRDAFKCHGPSLEKKFKSMMRIFMAGFWVYFQYKLMDIAKNSSFKTSDVILSSRRLLKRLDEEVSLCRTDEKNVTAEMKRTMLEIIPRNVTTMARALLRSLEDKYDTKKWVVAVFSEDSRKGKLVQFPRVRGDGFHLANTQDGFVAIAISVDRIGNPKFDELIWAHLNDSMRQKGNREVKSRNDCLFYMNPKGPNPNEKAACDYTNRISEPLEKLKGEGGFCYLTLWKNCKISDLTIVTSNNATWAKQVLFQDVKCFKSIQVLTLALNKTTYTNTDKKVLQKQEIENGMKQIVNNVALRRDRVGVADALLHFLEDIFSSTRKWIVVVISDGDTNKVDHFQSGGFYTASAGGLFAAAVSVNCSDEDPQVREIFKNRLKNFTIPIETTVDSKTHSQNKGAFTQKRKDGAYVIHQMLNNYVFPPLSSCANVTVESIVITTPCKGERRRIFDYVTMVATSGLISMVTSEEDECAQMLIISLPVRTGLVMSFNGPQYYCNHLFNSSVSERIDLLRNEYGQVYLSVEGNSNKENKRIIVDRRWMDWKSQRWQFVNNKLKNGHGKCLTARTKESQVLYQQTCLADSFPGQTWNRKGLQIVNGFNLCLALKIKEKNARSSYYDVLQDLCDTTPPFLWYNWDVDLEDKIIVHSTGNGSRALRNDFSRRYLSVSLEGKVRHEQWSNQPGQNWQVVNKQLRNGLGTCLTNNGTFLARRERCTGGKQKTKIWTLNDKRQIVCAHHKCLSVGDKNGYVTCVSCNDTPKQYWR